MSLSSVITTHLLVCLFGLGSWIAINGLWVELPILVMDLPEGWELGSYLAVIIQLANIGPLCFTLGNILFPKTVIEKLAAYVIIFVGIVSCLLLVHVWDLTTYIAGTKHSTALLILQFFLALVDCTSSVVFLPFMSTMKEQYLMTYYIGEGLSGFLPSIVALIQGVGGVACINTTSLINITGANDSDVITTTKTRLTPKFLDPHFSVEDFFYFLFAMMVVCGISFTLINNLKLCKLEYAPVKPVSSDTNPINPSLDNQSNDALTPEGNTRATRTEVTYSLNHTISPENTRIRPVIFYYLLLLIVLINALGNGILPSIQSYSCLPYGTSVYHYAVTLSSIANPVACFVAFFLPAKAISIITSLTILGMSIAGYIIAVACMSPSPFLLGNITGSILIVCAWVLVTFLMTYAKVNIAMLFRREGRKALLWCGAVTQLGSAIGAINMFVLVTVLKVFITAPYC